MFQQPRFLTCVVLWLVYFKINSDHINFIQLFTYVKLTIEIRLFV